MRYWGLKWKLLVLILSFAGLNAISQPNNILLKNSHCSIEVFPESFTVTFLSPDGIRYSTSNSNISETVSDLVYDSIHISWTYGKSGITVRLELLENCLDVSIHGSKNEVFTWPCITSGPTAFTVPFYQGKYIPANDPDWIEHLEKNSPFAGLQDLSMQFVATNFDKLALVYIIKNQFNNELDFYNNNGTLALNILHDIPETAKNQSFGYRIYLVKNDITEIAWTYKKYIMETSGIISLEEKASKNQNIRKLYGAPHIYVWNEEFLVRDDIKDWRGFADYFVNESSSQDMNPTKYLINLFNSAGSTSGKEFMIFFHENEKGSFLNKYGQNTFLKAIHEVLLMKNLYNLEAWKAIPLTKEIKRTITSGVENLNNTELYHLNQLLFKLAYSKFLDPITEWGGVPLSMLDEMWSSGIKKAWLGLSNWRAAEIHPEFVEKANKLGYLIGPYDNYHDIQEPGKEIWEDAKFEDSTLYYNAYVMNKNGSAIGGFLGAGRKLNPALSFKEVEFRTNRVFEQGIKFNSWFIDCDATGEFFDDYTPGRMTGQKDEMDARLKRMAWIRDTYKLVIGSEVGNDFSAGTIAFAHGMTTPIIEWGDPDMRINENSEYYTGSYFSSSGGIPGRYVKQAPIKDIYTYLYYDNRFNLPLFQLVYHNSVITSHHWEWGSLKVPSEIRNNQLKEILYDVPPLYHLDQDQWLQNKKLIIKHTNVFERIHSKEIKNEMTEFVWLTKDRLVQKTRFGEELEIVANFGTQPFLYKDQSIPEKALLIYYLNSKKHEIYQP
jgi:Glycosyl hydrolases related to GH101 family, GH129